MLAAQTPGLRPIVTGCRFVFVVTLPILVSLWPSESVQSDDESEAKAILPLQEQVTRLLAELKELQVNRKAGSDPWARKMKELIELGPDAVPALSRALIETPVKERRMLRSLPFILRGIGDKRAVPALIQTLPKCNGNDGSDMGYDSKDKELLAFMRKHDDDLKDRDPRGYNWGRPINEVRTALEKLTGTEHGETELCHIHGQTGTPLQQFLKNELYIRCAQRWAEWWEENWRDHVTDEAWSKVSIPDPPKGVQFVKLNRDAGLVITSRMSNMMCQPVFDGTAERVFYDLDTGRKGPVHKRWRGAASPKNERIISKWAVSQGYDIMGSQVEVDGKVVYVLWLLGAEGWEVPFSYWEKYRPTSATNLIKEGRPVQQILAIHDQKTKSLDYRGTGLFFVITQSGTPAFVRLGIDVHDTDMSQLIGKPSVGDNELNPKGFTTGRRFAVRLLQEPTAD